MFISNLSQVKIRTYNDSFKLRPTLILTENLEDRATLSNNARKKRFDFNKSFVNNSNALHTIKEIQIKSGLRAFLERVLLYFRVLSSLLAIHIYFDSNIFCENRRKTDVSACECYL